MVADLIMVMQPKASVHIYRGTVYVDGEAITHSGIQSDAFFMPDHKRY